MSWKSLKHRERKTFFYDKNKDEINIQHTDGSVRVPAIENDAEYLGKSPSHPSDRFKKL